MAEDLSIKVRVEPDVSDVPKKLSVLENSLAPLRVDIKLDNLGDVRGQIAALKQTVDVTINPVIAGGSLQNTLNNSLKGQKVNLGTFDTSQLEKSLQNINSEMTKAANSISAALKTKVNDTIKVTASNITGLSGAFGTVEKKIQSISDKTERSKLMDKLNNSQTGIQTRWKSLLKNGTISTDEYAGMTKELSILRKEADDIVNTETKQAAKIEASGKKLETAYTNLIQKQTKLESDYNKKLKGTNFTTQSIDDTINGTNGVKSISDLKDDVEAKKNAFESNKSQAALDAYTNSVNALTQALKQLAAEFSVAVKNADDFEKTKTKNSDKLTQLLDKKTDLENLATNSGNQDILQGKKFDDVTTAADEAKTALESFNADMSAENLQAYETALEKLKFVLNQFRDELNNTINDSKRFTSARSENNFKMTELEQKGDALIQRYGDSLNNKKDTLLNGVDTTALINAYTAASTAQDKFNKDMNTANLEAYKQAIVNLESEINNLKSSLDSANKKADSAFNNLPTQITRVESTLNTLRSTYREQQNRDKSDATVEATINTYEKVLERMRAIEASGSTDYSQFTQMFAEFDQQLNKAGIHINTFTDFMQAMVSVATQAKASISDLGNAFKQQQNVESLNKRLSNMLYTLERYVEINKRIQGNAGAMSEYRGIKETIQTALRSTDGGFKTQELSAAAEALSKFKTEMQEMGLEGKTLSQVFENLFGQHFSTMVAMGALHMMQNSLQLIYQNVLDIDTAMTELKKVTDETSATYSNFLNEAGERAKELGASIDDVVSATADFARLGYNLQDATKIADSAILFKQVGDGVQDINEASEDIISAMKAFNIEAENSVEITDRFNAIGNNYAITSAGTADALQRSAAALAAAGNSIDQSLGMIVAANDVAQSPEQVGNALKVLSLRIRGASAELEAMGEDADGAAISTAKLQSEIKALSGVDIMKDATTFKSTFEILDELADKWSELSDISRASILEDLAGKNRASVVAGMLENWDDARAAMETARDSAGKQNYLNVQRCA